jgi:hypothetical protein
MAGSFRDGTCTVDMLPSVLGMLVDVATRLHIAPSELNTPIPKNGSNILPIAVPRINPADYLPVRSGDCSANLSHSSQNRWRG